jgi:hypothetical protein
MRGVEGQQLPQIFTILLCLACGQWRRRMMMELSDGRWRCEVKE